MCAMCNVPSAILTHWLFFLRILGILLYFAYPWKLDWFCYGTAALFGRSLELLAGILLIAFPRQYCLICWVLYVSWNTCSIFTNTFCRMRQMICLQQIMSSVVNQRTRNRWKIPQKYFDFIFRNDIQLCLGL